MRSSSTFPERREEGGLAASIRKSTRRQSRRYARCSDTVNWRRPGGHGQTRRVAQRSEQGHGRGRVEGTAIHRHTAMQASAGDAPRSRGEQEGARVALHDAEPDAVVGEPAEEVVELLRHGRVQHREVVAGGLREVVPVQRHDESRGGRCRPSVR